MVELKLNQVIARFLIQPQKFNPQKTIKKAEVGKHYRKILAIGFSIFSGDRFAIEPNLSGGFAQKVAFQPCREAERKILQ
jgi:hypothetical protein